MAIIVHSPHDGQAVKVRDQDLERAIRDGEGRIFYAVKRSDGSGYYGALTRKGSDKDEQRYLEMLKKMQTAREVGKARSAEQIHDATGKASGPGLMRWVLLLIVAVLIATAVWYLTKPDNSTGGTTPGRDLPEAPSQDGPASPLSGAGADALSVTAVPSVGYVGTASGLRYKILQPGTGEAAVAGRYVLVAYTATTLAGEPFDQSVPDRPTGFVLWKGEVPRGWDEGVLGMRVG